MRINTDLTKVLTPKYANKWVAMNAQQTKVLVASRSPKRLLEIIGKKGYQDAVITYAVEDYRVFVS